jgi:hypothetical protein
MTQTVSTVIRSTRPHYEAKRYCAVGVRMGFGTRDIDQFPSRTSSYEQQPSDRTSRRKEADVGHSGVIDNLRCPGNQLEQSSILRSELSVASHGVEVRNGKGSVDGRFRCRETQLVRQVATSRLARRSLR